MTRRTQLTVFTLIGIVLVILAGIILLQSRLATFDANLYATMTAVR